MAPPHPIPYQGSKRRLASTILTYFPDQAGRLIEPFAGSAAVSLAAAYHNKASHFVLNDVNPALMALWSEIINRPDTIAEQYEKIWRGQHNAERQYYNQIRDVFNRSHEPGHFLFLLTRCVKAAVRYNTNGEFNQSPDNRRRGTHPQRMRRNILDASRLLRQCATLSCASFEQALQSATPSDIIYMDPPYQGVCQQRDSRYIEGLHFDKFVSVLEDLNRRGLSYIVSYDGRTGGKRYGAPLPDSLHLSGVELNAGRSTQATLLGRDHSTYESLYLSQALVAKIKDLQQPSLKVEVMQPVLFEVPV